MGDAAADRLLELPSNPIRMNTPNQQLSESLSSLMELKKDLSDLIETNAWDKLK
jgi:hypothetical protein